MALREFTLQLSGTSVASVSGATTPAAGKVWTIIGFTVTNRTTGALSFDVYKALSGVNTYLADRMPLPAFNNHYTIGQLGKHIVLPGGLVYVKSTVAASIDVTMTVSEDDNS
jgi:hypothetical protein